MLFYKADRRFNIIHGGGIRMLGGKAIVNGEPGKATFSERSKEGLHDLSGFVSRGPASSMHKDHSWKGTRTGWNVSI
jgi:hypothetical protein